ncbi:ADP-ribosylation factor-like protein 2-binding protein [Macrosteles quadrilineatus]|uniref:ADP-ribosylation factor-like protein 2-binding protein n=1 Tax=Macrosteles quadrilineatus TaxID=74068 RepID=UPI0023E16803|nr:ADP-ribosylation factor-like protein 2-binding protein [Macrosteles quadrilineatus]
MDFIEDIIGDSNTAEYLLKFKKNDEISEFDRTIGHIEDILIDEEFETLQKEFLEKYWMEFENKEENKHTYMIIFQEYTTSIEAYLEERLKLEMPDFCMKTFSQSLIERKNELEGEVFEMLLTFSDFLSFKEMVLDYRAVKEGVAVDFSQDLQITSLLNPSTSTKAV